MRAEEVAGAQAVAERAEEAAEANEAEEEQPELGPPFTVTLQCLSGASFEIRAQPLNRLGELYVSAAAELGKAKHELRLIHGERVLGLSSLGSSLESLGIGEGVVLHVMVRAPERVDSPGASTFNSNYVCQVHAVEVVGWEELRVDFEVRGDMSLGALQSPLHSSLSWPANRRTRAKALVQAMARPKQQDLVIADADKHLKGSLTFTGVPTTGHFEFKYGSSGYSALELYLPEESSMGEDAAGSQAGAKEAPGVKRPEEVPPAPALGGELCGAQAAQVKRAEEATRARALTEDLFGAQAPAKESAAQVERPQEVAGDLFGAQAPAKEAAQVMRPEEVPCAHALAGELVGLPVGANEATQVLAGCKRPLEVAGAQAVAEEAAEAKEEEEEEEQPELGPPFTVTLQSMSGASFEIRAQPLHRLGDFYVFAAAELGKAKHELRLIHGERVLGLSLLGSSLESLGIGEGVVLHVMVRSPERVDSPGASVFNNNYVCQVHAVEVVGWAALRVDFEVRGDMSLGPLQSPLHSTLSWPVNAEGQSGVHPPRSRRGRITESRAKARPQQKHLVITDPDKHLKGSLTFTGVPTTGHFEFKYGSGGYSDLRFYLTEE